MKSQIIECPRCNGQMTTTRYDCPECGTSIQGQFRAAAAPFARLNPEQIHFLVTFVRCEGKINRMEEELGISYPTIRNRLYEIIAMLESGRSNSAGTVPPTQPPATEIPPPLPDNTQEIRRKVLADLERGQIFPDEALSILRGEKSS